MSVTSADPSNTAARPTCKALEEKIRRRTRQLLEAAAPLCSAHRAPVPDPVVLFDLRGQAAGQAVWQRARRPLLRFNLEIARSHRDDFLERTVAHEVAHLVTAVCHPRARPHGNEWRAVMRHLGIDAPRRCHDYAVDESTTRRQRRWIYVCECSRHEITTTRHNRIQAKGVRYHCRRCGSLLEPASATTLSGTMISHVD